MFSSQLVCLVRGLFLKKFPTCKFIEILFICLKFELISDWLQNVLCRLHKIVADKMPNTMTQMVVLICLKCLTCSSNGFSYNNTNLLEVSFILCKVHKNCIL